MKFIVGLGNPGVRYQKTRHNIGRRLIEFLAAREKSAFVRDKKIAGMTAAVSWNGEKVFLVYPEVFMNVSGETLRKIKDHYPVNPQTDLLAVVDDAALPFGAMRLRPQGSSGGHNGLKSIAESLGTDVFSRLRLGISHPGCAVQAAGEEEALAGPLQDYVLEPFQPDEEKQMPDVLRRAEEACRLWLALPIERAMNAVNQRPERS